MRTALKSCVVLHSCVVLLFSAVLVAQTAPAKKKSSGAVTAATSKDVRELRQALAAQGQQIQQMQEEMRRRDQLLEQMQQALAQAQTNASTAQEKAAAAQSLASQQGESVSKVQSDLADVKLNQTNAAASTQEDQKRVANIEGIVGRFRFTGDVRVRQEDFSAQDNPGCAAGACRFRARERIRVRFGFEGKLNEDFNAGIFLASGIITDPTSTNETLTSVFERKTISFDRGYITYNPQAHK
ncbi:MAG: putative porin, partial [Acidobacteriota bacterium]|nr:putative porin [Acidobacteriota bacterium]